MEPSKLICGDSVGKAPDAHAVDVLQVDQVLYVGGSLPPEIILSLPTFTFSYADLKCLAAASKSMLRTIRSGESWKGLYLNVDCEELNCPQRLRCMENLWRSAGGVLFSLKQLAMLIDWPERTFIKFTTVSGQVPRPGGRLLHSFSSAQPLLGMASMELTLPKEACGMYMGVESLNRRLSSWCRVDNIFTDLATWSFGVNDSAPQPFPGASGRRLVASIPNKFQVRWSERYFAIQLNGEGQGMPTRLDVNWFKCLGEPARFEA